jgi:hypothetical protein
MESQSRPQGASIWERSASHDAEGASGVDRPAHPPATHQGGHLLRDILHPTDEQALLSAAQNGSPEPLGQLLQFYRLLRLMLAHDQMAPGLCVQAGLAAAG